MARRRRAMAWPIRDVRERETAVIARAANAARATPGALDADTAARMFAVIVAETRALQQRQTP